jgi:NAD(P)-dependent dehydrogenase (short-subunit alcohol dehydrogenase family)
LAQLDGKNAVVTGASRGIGRGIALKLANDGARVVVGYRADLDRANEVVSQITESGGEAFAAQLDTTDVDQIKDVMSAAKERFGQLNIVVSNAGIEHFGTLGDVTPEDFDRVFAVNARGQYFVMQQGSIHLEDGGRIICMSSISARQGNAFPRHAVYAGSKAAVETMAHNLALELGPRQITVNAIVPGAVATDMAFEYSPAYMGEESGERWTEDRFAEIVSSVTPLGRAGAPADIANVVAFLCSEEGGWISGQTIVVSGGA